MAEVHISVDKSIGLTVLNVSGALQPDELGFVVDAYYNGKRSNLVLWDISKASMADVSTDSLRSGVVSAKRYSRKGDRKAFVFSNDLEFGLGRMIEAYCNIEQYQSSIGIFRTVREAMKWLKESKEDHR